MSTFDGYVKEFPTIRIDYFRHDSSRPMPSACFLSHVHSDHLLGLESHRSTFVYCSAATRRLLLRMEKYPHRINFAKGILETRKQHYRHLQTKLRALPLQTATEIELGPKLKIQVTLFDANHCPGAVSFLVEGDGHAVLYTGDVRAEPWWVNSLVQNPNLLPYACGLKRLDCIYLDTTFASHENRYKYFQTRAEGLRELITQVSQHPRGTKFYFRAWTLGYEQVWVTLANLLKCTVHVDEYQLRLFTSIVEDGQHGFSMFEGPSLVGFNIGNTFQPGCLSLDSATEVHSCEPGTACHARLSKEDVVWITPIISRLPDGTELRELGAGGGGGDLYQTPELEVTDELTIQAIEKMSSELMKDVDSLDKVRDAIEFARTVGASSISLEGLGLDSDAEIGLKDFVQLISEKRDWKGRKLLEDQARGTAPQQRTIRFPYSRHSSYDEQRHLVSVFRPKDVYACTVDVQGWTEEVSMKSLFGDLCSENIFDQDQMVRKEALLVKEATEAKRRKRKRDEDSQNGDELPQRSSPSFHSAHTGLMEEPPASNPKQSHTDGPPPEAMGTQTDDGSLDQQPILMPDATVTRQKHAAGMIARAAAIKEEFQKINGRSDIIVIDDDDDDDDHAEHVEADPGESQLSLTTTAFESQDRTANKHEEGDVPTDHKSRKAAGRKEAYRLARRGILSSDSGEWDDLNIRSIGRRGHSEDELEL